MCAKYKKGDIFVGKDKHIYAVRKLEGTKDPCAGCCFRDTKIFECLHKTLRQVCGTDICASLIPSDMIFKDITKGV